MSHSATVLYEQLLEHRSYLMSFLLSFIMGNATCFSGMPLYLCTRYNIVYIGYYHSYIVVERQHVSRLQNMEIYWLHSLQVARYDRVLSALGATVGVRGFGCGPACVGGRAPSSIIRLSDFQLSRSSRRRLSGSVCLRLLSLAQSCLESGIAVPLQ